MVHTVKFLVVIFSVNIFVYSQNSNQNQVTIRSDRVILINGQPFFPIGTCFERQDRYAELVNNGFNFINLFNDNHFVYSDSCGFGSKNIISGDVTTSKQYNEMLGAYGSDLRWEQNAQRIFNYMRNDKFYVFGDNFPFLPDDVDRSIINLGSCGDSIILNPKFDQNARNQSIDRIVNISNWPGNRIIGLYANDDANLFEIGSPDPLYYYNTYFNTRVNNYIETYNHLKQNYPNSLVLMNLPATYFPRIVDFTHWQNIDTAMAAWIRDALQFSQAADVLFYPGNLSYESYPENYMIYRDRNPTSYTYALEQTIFGRVLAGKNKAVFGGLQFDDVSTIPDSTDPKALDKIKWHIYVGIEKGCTGLIFFGWHKYARPDGGISIATWNKIKIVINEMVNKLHLNDKVFIETNNGQVGHSISGSYSSNVSYAVYKANGWNDYYLLVTNNPNGGMNATEPENIVTIACDRNIIDWSNSTITEMFTNQKMNISPDFKIQYTMPWFGTAIFHVQPAQPPSYFSLSQNYPNPFNPKTIINYQLPVNSNVKIIVYDIQGREVQKLIDAKQNAGSYNIVWDGSNYSSSVYFYELYAITSTGSYRTSKKMVLLK